jgi:phosphomannomutase/NDP-sugar pyrophosphorylase family protein
MQAIILAGGTDLSLRPLTARNPRSLVPLVNKPLVRYQIELLARHGVTEVILCIDHHAERFERYFSDHSVDRLVKIHLHRDSTPRGTAGAVKAVESLVTGESVLVLNGDILSDVSVSNLVAFHESKSAVATVYLSASSDPNRYGVVLTDSEGRIQQFIEKPGIADEAPTDTINAGIYVFRREVLHHIPTDVAYSLERSLFPALLEEHVPTYGLLLEAYWHDIATLTDYRQAQEDILTGRVDVEIAGVNKGNQLWVGQDAQIHPTADIAGPVVIGKGVKIAKNVMIRGPVSIGSSCRIEQNAIIDRSTIWRNGIVESGAVVRGCILGDDCIVKEGASVQQGSVLGDGAVVASYFASVDQSEHAARRNNIRFGTDGWRGIIADDFTGENVRLVAQSAAEFFLEAGSPGEPLVVIGYDNRSQSEYFAAEAAKVMADAGLRTILANRACSSPAVSFLVKRLGARGGLVVTASHNPPNFNGLKIKAYYGGSASPALISRIEKHLHQLIDLSATEPIRAYPPEAVTLTDLSEPYLDHCVSMIDLSLIRKANHKIVVDPMHGSGAGYLPAVFERAGITNFLEIRGERNPVFGGINPEPIDANMLALRDAVISHNATVGIALDGDADRVGAVDGQGRFVDSHRIFCVILKHLIEHRKWSGGVVKTVSTTKMIDKLAAKYHLRLFETPIGFKHICDLMLQEDILIGGEESGGIGIKNHIPERDGVLMGLLILEAMAASGRRLETLIDDIFAEVGRHEYERIDLHPEPASMHRIISSLQSYQPSELIGRAVADVSRKDGTKITLADGAWLLLRPSGTEPVVRIYAEAESREGVAALLDAGKSVIDAA